CLLLARPLVAHEGHDHDKPPPLALPIAPRVTAVTPGYELVGVLSRDRRMAIFLHRFSTNQAGAGARPSGSAGEEDVEAVAREPGVFELTAPWLGGDGPVELVFKLTLPDDQDLLTGRLQRTVATPAQQKFAWWDVLPVLLVGAGALMAGIVLTLLI